MVETHKVKHRRPRKGDDSSQYECVFKYHVLLQGKRIQVSRDAFFGLYAASDKKSKRIRKLLKGGISPKDMRGKISPSNKKSAEVLKLIHDHIKSCPVKTAHYSAKVYNFLSSELTARTMYDLFLIKRPDVD